MDHTTVGGIILGIALIVIAITVEGSLLTFFSFSSLLIVVGGVIATTLINYPISYVVTVIKVVRVAFKNNTEDAVNVIAMLVSLAEKARREGLLALENEVEDSENEFLKKGIQMVVDGTDPEIIRCVLETEISMMEERHEIGFGMFEAMGTSAPAFGMLGTLIGLILMLKQIEDPSSLGPGMALALITTFYGSILANLIFLPIAGKLRLRSKEEVLTKLIILEGVLSIQAGENPRLVAEKMKAFLHPHDQVRLDQLRNQLRKELRMELQDEFKAELPDELKGKVT